MYRAHVSTSLVQSAHAPVEPNDLVSYWVDAVGGVEILELVGEELTDVEEDQTAHSEQVVVVRVMHDSGHLFVFVAVYVNAPRHGQGGEFVVLFVFGYVGCAEDGLVFVENAVVLDCAVQMVHARTSLREENDLLNNVKKSKLKWTFVLIFGAKF